MKVVLAAQTLSKSVSNALKSLQNQPGFEGSQPTADFVKMFNDLFDILNSMNSNAEGFKKPLDIDNFTATEQVFADATTFIKSILLPSGQPVLQSVYKTGFLGFLVDIQSVTEMFKELVVKRGVLQCVY